MIFNMPPWTNGRLFLLLSLSLSLHIGKYVSAYATFVSLALISNSFSCRPFAFTAVPCNIYHHDSMLSIRFMNAIIIFWHFHRCVHAHNHVIAVSLIIVTSPFSSFFALDFLLQFACMDVIDTRCCAT